MWSPTFLCGLQDTHNCWKSVADFPGGWRLKRTITNCNESICLDATVKKNQTKKLIQSLSTPPGKKIWSHHFMFFPYLSSNPNISSEVSNHWVTPNMSSAVSNHQTAGVMNILDWCKMTCEKETFPGLASGLSYASRKAEPESIFCSASVSSALSDATQEVMFWRGEGIGVENVERGPSCWSAIRGRET